MVGPVRREGAGWMAVMQCGQCQAIEHHHNASTLRVVAKHAPTREEQLHARRVKRHKRATEYWSLTPEERRLVKPQPKPRYSGAAATLAGQRQYMTTGRGTLLLNSNLMMATALNSVPVNSAIRLFGMAGVRIPVERTHRQYHTWFWASAADFGRIVCSSSLRQLGKGRASVCVG